MKLDTGAAWAQAMKLLGAHREVLVALAGVFLLLPPLFVEIFAPFRPAGETFAVLAAEFRVYIEANGPLLLAMTVISTFGQAAILTIVLDRDQPTVAQALRVAIRLLPWLLLLNLLVGIVLAVASMALLIPALYLFGRLAVTGVVLVGEGRHSPVDAISRSWQVTRGNGWRSFFLIAVVAMVGWVISAAAGAIVGIAAKLLGGSAVALFFAAFVNALFGAALGLVLLLLYVAIYRQLVREG